MTMSKDDTYVNVTSFLLEMESQIVFLDQVDDPGPKEEDFPFLKKIEGKWMANLGCLTSMDRNHGLNVRDDARPKQNWN